MTGRELVRWIEEHQAEDAEIKLIWDDDPGFFASYKDARPEIVVEKPFEYIVFK
jgi:hypothetical protein